jgi:hypothetical protein
MTLFYIRSESPRAAQLIECQREVVRLYMKTLSQTEIIDEIKGIKQEIQIDSSKTSHVWNDPYNLFLFAQQISLEEASYKDPLYEEFRKKPVLHFSILMASSPICPPCIVSKRALLSGNSPGWEVSFSTFKKRIRDHLSNIVEEIFRPSEQSQYQIPKAIKSSFLEVYPEFSEKLLSKILKIFDECFYTHLIFLTPQELNPQGMNGKKYFLEYNSQFLSKIILLGFRSYPTFYKMLFDSQFVDQTSLGNAISLSEYTNPSDNCPPDFLLKEFANKWHGRPITNLSDWIVETPLMQVNLERIISDSEKLRIKEEADRVNSDISRENDKKSYFIKNLAQYFFIRLVQELK